MSAMFVPRKEGNMQISMNSVLCITFSEREGGVICACVIKS